MRLNQLRSPLSEADEDKKDSNIKAVEIEPGETTEIAQKAKVHKSTASRWSRKASTGPGGEPRHRTPRAETLVTLPSSITTKLEKAIKQRIEK